MAFAWLLPASVKHNGVILFMRFLFCFCCLGGWILFVSCGNNNTPAQDLTKATAPVDTSQFYPLEPFLDQEISFVELRNFNLTARWQKGQTVLTHSLSKAQWVDSVQWIKTSLEQFWNGHKDQFQEKSFEDLGTEKTVFDYTANDSAYSLQQVTIQTDNRTQQIKTLYVVVKEKNAFVGEILHRISWRAQASVQWVRWHKQQPAELSETLRLDWKPASTPL